MKMKPKVTAAMMTLLPLLHLSAITGVESPHTKAMSRSITTQITSPIKDLQPECDNYEIINLWFNKQLMLSNNLAENILHLDIHLNETCDFYEKDVMQSIIENVEKINHLNKSHSLDIPKIGGNLGKDLDQLLPLLKKLVPKGFKKLKCCEELESYLNEVKDQLQEKWEDLKNEITQHNGKEKSKIKEKLQEKQEYLGEQLENVQQQLENIQEKSGSVSNINCCGKINRKITNLQNELNKVNTEANDYRQDFGEKLKKIKDKVESKIKEAIEVNETLGNREKKMQEIVKKFDNGNIASNCSEKEIEERIRKMENRVKDQAYKNNSSANQLNITLCQTNGEKLIKIEAQLDELLKDKNKQGNEGTRDGGSEKGGFEKKGSINENGSSSENREDRFKKLQQEADKLRERLKNSDTCCEKTDHLHILGDNLLKSIDQMNQTYDEHIKRSALDLNETKSLLQNATDKLGSITKNRKDRTEGRQKQTGEDFQNQLTNLQSELDKAKDDFKNLQNKLSELPNSKDEPINSSNHKLSDNLKEQLKKFNENWLKADKRLQLLEERAANKSLDRLEKLLESLQQDIISAESEIGRLENREPSHKANMEKLTNLENQITPCRNSCNDLEKINDLLDQIEDLERFFKTKLALAAKPTKNIIGPEDNGALVGGIDVVDQITDPSIFSPQG